MTVRKVRMRPRVPWRPALTDEQVAEIAALVPDGFYVSIYPQLPGTYRMHLIRDGVLPPVASRHGVSGSFAWYVEQMVAEAGVTV